MTDEKAGSFLPEDFSEGGFFDDKDATIVSAEVVPFDYAGKNDAICAMAITYKPDEAEDDEDNRTEYYKVGELSKFTPSSDKKRYIAVGGTTHMNKTCKAALFIKAIKERGFEMSKLANGIDGLVGLHCHVNIVPLPEMKGIDKKDLKILIVTKIHDAPAANAAPAAKAKGGKKAEKATPAAATTAVAPAAAAASSDAEDKAVEIIMGLITDAPEGKLNSKTIPQAMFTKIPQAEAALRNACIKLAGNGPWLSAAERPWQNDGGQLSFPS